MTETTDPAALVARATELLTKATPGPWHTDPTCGDEIVINGDGVLVADCCIFLGSEETREGENDSNSALIAAAPTLIADLASALEAALARIEQAEMTIAALTAGRASAPPESGRAPGRLTTND